MVGAAARYGAVALVVGTTVKLTRALWIVPVSISAAMVKRSDTRIQWPWFIGLFCLAAVVNTYVSAVFRDLACDEHDWKARLDCDSLLDRNGNFSRHGSTGWRASDAAGRVSMDCGGDHFFMAYFFRMDFALALRVRSSSELTEDGWRGLCWTRQVIDNFGKRNGHLAAFGELEARGDSLHVSRIVPQTDKYPHARRLRAQFMVERLCVDEREGRKRGDANDVGQGLGRA